MVCKRNEEVYAYAYAPTHLILTIRAGTHTHTHAQATSQARHEIEKSLTQVHAQRETLAADLEALDVRLVN